MYNNSGSNSEMNKYAKIMNIILAHLRVSVYSNKLYGINIPKTKREVFL